MVHKRTAESERDRLRAALEEIAKAPFWTPEKVEEHGWSGMVDDLQDIAAKALAVPVQEEGPVDEV